MFALSSLGCVPLGETARPRRAKGARRPLVVLVAIDGVCWQDVFQGSDPRRLPGRVPLTRRRLVPHLVHMEKHGAVFGAPETGGFHASGPNFVSLPGYMEMLSGSSKTGCYNNGCRRIELPSLLDDFAESPGSHPASAAAFSSWPKVEQAASSKSQGITSAGRNGGFNLHELRRYPKSWELFVAGRSAHAMKEADAGFRPDKWTAELAYTFLREADPDFLFVSLGETDEWAHVNNYSKYLEALRAADHFVGRVRKYLRSSGRETALFVTTDHGRSHGFRDHGQQHPESSRGFLFLEGNMFRRSGRIQVERATYLKDIAPTVRAIAGLPPRYGSDHGRSLVELLV